MIFLTKNMKKLIVIAAALLIGLQANAQLIFNGGYLHGTEGLKRGEQTAQNVLDGFYAGAKYRFALDGITEGLSIAPGANLSAMFCREAGFAGNLQAANVADELLKDARRTELALNIPLHVQYLYEITPDFKLEAWAGPTFQLGIWNRSIDGDSNPTLIYNNYKEIVEGPLKFAPRNRINLFLGLGVGFEVAELVHINAGYDFGLLNLSTTQGEEIYRGLLRVGVGYNF